MQNSNLISNLQLKGLEIAPSQVRGAIRIVPIIKRNIRYDLRLWGYQYDEPLARGSIAERENCHSSLLDREPEYYSYIPDGLVMFWCNDDSPVAADCTQLDFAKGKKILGSLSKAMFCTSKKIARNRLRFLPLHLAMEGFLSMFYGRPTIAWRDYSRYSRSHGLNPLWDISFGGQIIPGLEDALRVFEIHQGQVGVILFVAEELASVFVVPTPEDYRALHTTLLQDFYGDLIFQYACMYQTTYPLKVTVDDAKINNLQDLRREIEQIKTSWADFQGFMANSLLESLVKSQKVYQAGSFTLQRFLTSLDSDSVNHIGEAILRDTGELEYLKTYRLSEIQSQRIQLLTQLAEYDWNLDATAKGLKISRNELIIRFKKTSLDYLLTEQATKLKNPNVET